MDLFRERIANFLDETILLPYEEFLTELAKAYPETTRSVYRYGKVPIRKVQLTFINLFIENMKSPRIINWLADSQLPEEEQPDHQEHDPCRWDYCCRQG